MAELLETFGERIKSLGGDWPKYAAVGSFALYLVGYLALRFHLTVLGIGTDLSVLDERYLFTGARFFVQACAAIPNLLLVALLAAAVLVPLHRLVPMAIRDVAERFWSEPGRRAAVGIVLALLLIQGAMRQCFLYTNLLVATDLPPYPAWLSSLLVGGWAALYFDALVAGCVVTGAILWTVRGDRAPFARACLAVLVAIQVLLLPVNYGMFIVDKSLPRVTSVGEAPVAPPQQAWLVWEGKDGLTWLVRSGSGAAERRSLVTLPRAKADRVEITGYDPLFATLFAGGHGDAR